MKLIEDLGNQKSGISGNKHRYGVYECPICTKYFRACTSNVKSGHTTKCIDCAHIATADTKIKEAATSFAIKASDIHNNRYSYILSDYLGSKVKVCIICPIHGEFWQTPNNHLKGMGCPTCASSGFDKTKSAVLYYLKIVSNNTVAYKIGITNRTVQERFNNTDLAKIQVLKTWDFPLGADALTKEQEILALHQEHKYLGEPLLSSGNTELFTQDILGLDISLALGVL